ncbi:hypothetical protein HL658_31375 [Azospirillum sp. RWY-5-1]|uniref:Minor tail protein n=1 Tax=Azospirillum oleiclasticum TaxID=2735135 RepID=A0ABX2TK26_9PROT|nr:hypothetical protein [Azospirillum oleiclasticum]NYZ17067.1 hypothetical protein [Azospirillum oleiclasticum]NYZ24489.1 hypothetical protein [Azospirillum oleiclasticum]
MPPVPSAPMHFDHKDVLIAVETEYGDDDGLTFQACRLWDVQATWLEADEKELPYVLKHMGNRHAELFSRRTRLTAKVGLVGCGAAADHIPLWDPFLRAGGAARTQVAKTANATIAAAATPGAGAEGAFTYARTTAYAGVFDRTVTLTCTTGGGTGVAAFTVAAPAVEYLPAYSETGVVMTTASPFQLPGGAEITPSAIGTPFEVGDSFTIALTAPGCLYEPSSDRTGHKSATLRAYLPDPSAGGGQERLYRMLGSRLNVKATGAINDFPYWEVEITSLFTAPAFAAAAVADYSGWPDPVEVSTANTPICRLFGHDLVAEQFGWDSGNTVELVERVGRTAVRINDRKSTASLKVEEPGLGDFDVMAAVAARTKGELLFQHGRAAGEVVRFRAAGAQIGKPTWSESKKDLMVDLPMRLVHGAEGDDEWSIFVPAGTAA